MGRLMKEFFSGSQMVDLAALTTLAFFGAFVFICWRMVRKDRSGRLQQTAALPLGDDEIILRPSDELGARSADRQNGGNQQ